MKNLNAIPNYTNTPNKEKKIENSLSQYKDIEKYEKDSIGDIKDRANLKSYLKGLSSKINSTTLFGWLYPQGLTDSIIDQIVDSAWKQFDEIKNNLSLNFGDWITSTFGSISGLITGEKLTNEQLEIRNFVDTVYGVGYSFDKDSSGNYVINDELGNEVTSLNKALSAINGGSVVGGGNIKNKKEILDDIILERSYTGKCKNIKEMIEIMELVGINPENKNEFNKLTPEILGEAYIKYYSKKANYTPLPDLNNPLDIQDFLINPSIKAQKIPIEKITYIKLYSEGAFDNQKKAGKPNNDVEVLKNIMSGYSEITMGTEEKLKGIKNVTSKTGKMLSEGLGGITKYMNGPEGLILMGAMIYLLFFSDNKKTAWMTIAGLAGADVLVKAYNKDPNSGIAQVVAEGLETVSAQNIDLPEALKGIDQTNLGNTKQKVNTISILSSKSIEDIKLKINIDSNGSIKVDTTLFDSREIDALEKVWGKGRYEQEVENMLTELFNSNEMKRFTGKNSAQDNLDYLLNERFKKRTSFSLLVAHVMLWNAANPVTVPSTVSTTGTTPVTPRGSTVSASPSGAVPVAVPTGPNLNIQPTITEKNNYKALTNTLSDPSLQSFIDGKLGMGLIKKNILNHLNSLLKPGTPISTSDQVIINNLITKIKS